MIASSRDGDGCHYFCPRSALYSYYMISEQSSVGGHKALSNCSSHNGCSFVPFACIYIYILPTGSENKNMEVSLFYIMIALMLNCLLYTLRNIEVKISIRKVWSRGFPGGAVVKNPPANAGDTGSSLGPGRYHMPRSN